VEDETPTLAAINEIKEEIGIRIKIENLRFLAITGDKQYRG
jgi:8-oxo-dGTP pyrophosphatase MutT (NUDIX family)